MNFGFCNLLPYFAAVGLICFALDAPANDVARVDTNYLADEAWHYRLTLAQCLGLPANLDSSRPCYPTIVNNEGHSPIADCSETWLR